MNHESLNRTLKLSMAKVLVKIILFFQPEKLDIIRVSGDTVTEYFFVGYLKELVKNKRSAIFLVCLAPNVYENQVLNICLETLFGSI